jgi:hypothetical protein
VGVGDTNRPIGLTKEQQQQAKQQQQQQQGSSSAGTEVDGSRNAAADSGRRKAPSKLSCSLLLDCMGELVMALGCTAVHFARGCLLSRMQQVQCT